MKPCLALPGTSKFAELLSDPVSYRIAVTGADETARFRACIAKVDHVDLYENGAPAQ